MNKSFTCVLYCSSEKPFTCGVSIHIYPVIWKLLWIPEFLTVHSAYLEAMELLKVVFDSICLSKSYFFYQVAVFFSYNKLMNEQP
jgi:hypothetical protein